jgi:UDP-glucose 4-epimerase
MAAEQDAQSEERAMKIALVGGAGLVGRALTRAAQAAGHEVVCLDRVRSPMPGTTSLIVDLVRDDVESAMGRAAPHRVVHLAARVDPPNGPEREAMRRLHVDGTRKLTTACTRIGVERLVLCSSSVVYGAWPDNPIPITEDQSRRPRPGFPYAVDKAAQEDVVAEVAGQLQVVVARPSIIYGPDARSYLTEFIRRAPGVLPALDGLRPPIDFVHVDDVATGLLTLATEEGVEGAYNIASARWLSFDEVAAVAGLKVVPIPRRVVRPLLDAGARLVPAHLRAPSYILDYLTFPFVTSPQKLKATTSWSPRYSSEDALRAMLAG